MSKRKASHERSTLSDLEINTEQVAAIQELADTIPPNQKCLLPLFEKIQAASAGTLKPHQKPLRTRQATYFKQTTQAAQALGIDYKAFNKSYLFELKGTHLRDPAELSEHFAYVIQELQTSEYVSMRDDESICRTILDLILVDRLRELKDRDTYRKLKLAAEVSVSVKVPDDNGNLELIRGRADWAVAYGDNNNTGSVLLVVEAKPYDNAPIGMPQLLVYMAAVHEAREGEVNQCVFGMLSDAETFRFAFLDEHKTLFLSQQYDWLQNHKTIIAYIDMILLNAIESSPHTTPQKTNNRVINKYPQYLQTKWNFGDQSDDEGLAEEEHPGQEGEDDDLIHVVKRDGSVTMRLHYRSRSPE